MWRPYKVQLVLLQLQPLRYCSLQQLFFTTLSEKELLGFYES